VHQPVKFVLPKTDMVTLRTAFFVTRQVRKAGFGDYPSLLELYVIDADKNSAISFEREK